MAARRLSHGDHSVRWKGPVPFVVVPQQPDPKADIPDPQMRRHLRLEAGAILERHLRLSWTPHERVTLVVYHTGTTLLMLCLAVPIFAQLYRRCV
jgi:hypothetical protein